MSSDFNPMVVLAGTVLVLAIILLARRFITKFFSRLFRVVFRPFRRLARATGRSGSLAKVARPRHLVGQSALASIGHVVFGESQIDTTLDENKEFKKSLLQHNRVLAFKWIQPLKGYIPHKPELSEDDAKAYFEESRLFFDKDTPVFEDPGSFYEEIEGRHIIEMFGVRDFGCYYFLNAMRRTVNANVSILTVWVSLLLSTFVIFNMFLNPILNWAHIHFAFYSGQNGSFVRSFEEPVLIAGSAVLTFLLIGGFTYMHSTTQRHAGRELNDFIIRYFAILGQQYTAANAECGRMYNNYATKAEADARSRPWFLAMEWIAFRLLFIETFARNAIYQIQRNSGFYVFYVPFAFAITLVMASQMVASGSGHPEFNLMSTGCLLYHLGWLFDISFAILIGGYFYSLHDVVAVFHDSLTPDQWNGFSSRNHRDTVARLIGLYNGEIVFQRGKFQGMH